ncbi:hypothetical protein HELRODRAFT_168236 [Helobdella robusta]|uniref:Uncharacterized protein n=1 Tax=Helobdella robusta TaxID=6412 RepID=T1F0C4_HELRO|nr:hypothetical protein HELRODRAFT_168236 [Helobdella robusta]ESO09274.1 hypothetical protein HELRODRAFT_168236 [Helobdella robusta]
MFNEKLKDMENFFNVYKSELVSIVNNLNIKLSANDKTRSDFVNISDNNIFNKNTLKPISKPISTWADKPLVSQTEVDDSATDNDSNFIEVSSRRNKRKKDVISPFKPLTKEPDSRKNKIFGSSISSKLKASKQIDEKIKKKVFYLGNVAICGKETVENHLTENGIKKPQKLLMDDKNGLAAVDPDGFTNMFDTTSSMYYTVDTIPVDFGLNVNNNFSVLHFNARSLLLKLNDLNCLPRNINNLKVISISETWLDDKTSNMASYMLIFLTTHLFSLFAIILVS